MKRLWLVVPFILFTVFFIPKLSHGQLSSTDSSLYHFSINNVVHIYHQTLKPEPGLYNGLQYFRYDFTLKEGHPFFGNSELTPGYIVYNHIQYNNVPLLYDLISEKLVINDPTKVYLLQLNSEHVNRFSVLGHVFIRIDEDNEIIHSGFYDVLYDGKTSLLKKQTKAIQEKITSVLEKFVVEDVSYFIKKEGKYFSINQKKSVLYALSDKKKEINQFIRKNKLNIRKNKDEAISKILAYYDALAN